MSSLAHLVRDAARRFEQAGIAPAEARLDAVLLARHLLDWDMATWIVHHEEPAPEGFVDRFEALALRRTGREPMAYLLGRAEFWGLDVAVSPAVLVPRPETELLVEEALARLPFDQPRRVADVGTGSGCVAVALACERPVLRVVATDVSPAALAIAARNCGAHGVTGRIDLVQGYLLDATAGPFDMVVSNPPYVAEADRPGLAPEVRDFEPALALFAPDDGLGVIKALVAQAASRLSPGGWLLFEFGFGQAEAVHGILGPAAWTDVSLQPDLQGIPRVAIARLSPEP